MIVEASAKDYALLLDNRAPRHFKLADTPVAPSAVLEMLAEVAQQVRATFSPASWLIIHEDEIVGLCAVTRPPDTGVIDLGYGVAPSRQGRGFASGAIADIVAWAHIAPGVVALSADTAPDNLASQRVLARNGFSKVGERLDDDDGLLICWRHALG